MLGHIKINDEILGPSPFEPRRCDWQSSKNENAQAAAMTRKQKIVQVTWSLVAGGSETYAFTIASNLDPERFSSFICAMDQGGPLEPEIAAAGIPYCVMARAPGIHLSLICRLFSIFKRTGASVVQTHHFNQLFYSAIGAKLAGARLIHTEHSVEYLKARRFRVALRLLSILCEAVVAISEDGASILRDQVGVPASKLRIIRAGVKTPQLRPSKEQARRELGIDQSDKVAVIIARLFPEKNHILLLDAFADVVKHVPAAKLLIVGEGTQRGAIESHIAKLGLCSAVTVMGVRRDIQRILAASDVFVLSSDREGLPIAAVEAMSMSRPVVATSVGDLPKLVSDRITGRLVPPKDRPALAQAICETLLDASALTQMGEDARKIANNNFGISRMIDDFEHLYW